MKGIILEGVTASGKSGILTTLQSILALERPACTKLFYSEHYTERVLEDRKADGLLDPASVIDYVEGMVESIERIAQMQARSKFVGRGGNSEIIVLIERFLGSHCANLGGPGSPIWRPSIAESNSLARMYARLSSIGIRPVMLTMDEDVLGRAILSTRRHRNAAWSDYLSSFGSDEDVVRYYSTWQSNLRRFYSELPCATPIQEISIEAPSRRESIYRNAVLLWSEYLS